MTTEPEPQPQPSPLQPPKYTNTLVGRVNRHRVIAVIVCVPLSLIVLYSTTGDHVTGNEALQTIVFSVATYSCATATFSAWPSRRKLAKAGLELGSVQIWLSRVMSIVCGIIALLAALGVYISVHNA